jgi:hypothetical protein
MKILKKVSEMRRFKCFECEVITNFPGLCRDCTTYDGEGNVVTPIKRIRVDDSGNEWKSSTHNHVNYTRDGLPLSKGFRRPKKLSKRQAMVVDEQFKQDKYWNAEIVNDMVDEVDGEGLIELGNSQEEE